MNEVLLGILLCSLTLQVACDWDLFWNGRPLGGNLGDPEDSTARSAFRPKTYDEEMWFAQKLNHFDRKNDTYWQQRYYVNDYFFKRNGPVFILIGGEGEASPGWMHAGAWIKFAKKLGALCFQLEHRYYGMSRPTPDVSTENLRFLSTRQALADLGHFVFKMNQKYNLTSNNKWIAFGGSYPASLAAWLRQKYHHLIHGAVSSSGPLLAKIDFFEYFEGVKESIATYTGCDCVHCIETAMKQIDSLLESREGQVAFNNLFSPCFPIQDSVRNVFDISLLFQQFANAFAFVVQHNKYTKIDDVCAVMCNETLGSPIERLVEVRKITSRNSKCLNYNYSLFLNALRQTSWESPFAEGTRQWFYQSCTELGLFQTTNEQSTLFGNKFPAKLFLQQCADVFGDNFSQKKLLNGIYHTNRRYGGLSPQKSNVMYVHASLDPWKKLGFTFSSENQTHPTIYIEGAAHCHDMYEPKDSDPSYLRDARRKIYNFIKKLTYGK